MIIVLYVISTGTKGTAAVEVCIKCKVQGKTMKEWSAYYSHQPWAKKKKKVDTKFAKGDFMTKYYATLEEFEERRIEEISKYTDHVTHCTPCNLDPSRNYVSIPNLQN
jgi:hypothetical protein